MEESKTVMQIPFMGFYESVHGQTFDDGLESWAEYEIQEGERAVEYRKAGITASDLSDARYWVTDYSAARRAYLESYVPKLRRALESEVSQKSDIPIEFESLSSPREYNFTTDRLFVTVSRAFVAKMREEVSPMTLARRIKTNHESRDGFCSYYPADLAKWDSKPLESWDHNELQTLFEAWLDDAGIDSEVYYQIETNLVVYEMLEKARAALDDATDWPAYEGRVAAMIESKTEEESKNA